MAATEVATKTAFNIGVNTGTTSAGDVIVKTMSLGKMSLSRYDVNSAAALTQLLALCLDKSIHRETEVKTSQVART